MLAGGKLRDGGGRGDVAFEMCGVEFGETTGSREEESTNQNLEGTPRSAV